MKKRIAIFASGSGTNAEQIMLKFETHKSIEIAILASNKEDAYALKRAEKFKVSTLVFNKSEFKDQDVVLQKMIDEKIDYIILAGFLWLVPQKFVAAFPNKIINIHPALLPKYGGKGMYGMKVHEAVVENNETETGITIHFVNEKYDEGEHIFQGKCEVIPTDSPDDVATKIHQLEYQYFPQKIEEVILKASE